MEEADARHCDVDVVARQQFYDENWVSLIQFSSQMFPQIASIIQ